MQKHPNRLWIVAILLGWAFDFLFWKQDVGLNFALFSTLCLLAGFGLLLADGFRPARKTLWLLIPFTFFAAVTFLRREPLTSFLAYAFAVFSLGVMASTYLGGQWVRYGMADYFSRFFRLILGMMTLPVHFQRETRTESNRIFFPILRGMLIALPVVLCFGALLVSADAVFDQKVNTMLKDFDLGEQTLRILIILACGYLLVGVFLHVSRRSGNEALLGEDKLLIRQFLGLTESSIVLGSVAILFLAFVIIQFQYFFGGQTNIGVEGYTYSQYARRGFNELITVALFSLMMILGLSTVTRRENEAQRRIYSGLGVIILAEVMVILVSAYQRLMLAIDWHGFSRLRLYPRVFMIWVGILLVAVVVLEILRRERHFALAFVLASLGFAASLTLINVDHSIVIHNLERVAQGRNLNAPDLASLSADAIPALVKGFHKPLMSAEQHEGIGAILVCHLHSDIMTASDAWRSFNFSRWHAKQILEEMKPTLAGYRYNDKKFPPMARTPSGVYYECLEIKD